MASDKYEIGDPTFVLPLFVGCMVYVSGILYIIFIMPESIQSAPDMTSILNINNNDAGGTNDTSKLNTVSGSTNQRQTVKIDIFKTFKNIYWLLQTITDHGSDDGNDNKPVDIHDSMMCSDVRINSISGSPGIEDGDGQCSGPVQGQHHQHVLVAMKAVPYLTVMYFLYYMMFMVEVLVITMYVIHIYDWDSSTIGYFDTSDAILTLSGVLFLPKLTNNYIIPWINVYCRCSNGSNETHVYSPLLASDTGTNAKLSDSALCIPLWSDLHWILVGFASRGVWYLAFGSSQHYTTTCMLQCVKAVYMSLLATECIMLLFYLKCLYFLFFTGTL